jgi:hypothetical protein
MPDPVRLRVKESRKRMKRAVIFRSASCAPPTTIPGHFDPYNPDSWDWPPSFAIFVLGTRESRTFTVRPMDETHRSVSFVQRQTGSFAGTSHTKLGRATRIRGPGRAAKSEH